MSAKVSWTVRLQAHRQGNFHLMRGVNFDFFSANNCSETLQKLNRLATKIVVIGFYRYEKCSAMAGFAYVTATKSVRLNNYHRYRYY